MRYRRRAKGRPATTASCALRILDAATICMALVICAVLPMDLIRRRKSCRLCMAIDRSLPGLFELIGCGLQVGRQGGTKGLLFGDLPEQLGFARGQELRQAGLELLDPVHGYMVYVSILNPPKHRYLHFDRDRVVLGLLEDFHDALAAVDLRLRFGIEFRTELCECRQLPKLRELPLELPGDLLHGFELCR